MHRFARPFVLLFFFVALAFFAFALAQRIREVRRHDQRLARASAAPGASHVPARADSLGETIAVAPAWLAARAPSGSAHVRALDTRTRADFERGHIARAIALPADSIATPAALPAILARYGVGAADTLVCYADAATIAYAARVVWLLESAGAPAVRFLDGGIEAWRAAGLPMETGAAGTRAGATPAWPHAPDSSRIATHAFVLANFGAKRIEILDARGPDAWEAEMPGLLASQWGEAGHIPHSLPFEFAKFIRADGTLAPRAEIRGEIRRAGPRPATPIDLDAEFVLYDDGAGIDAALGYLVLRAAGIERARCYPDGWAAWSSNASNPRVRIVGAAEMKRRADARATEPFLLFDMRTSNDFKAGHIPGATFLAAHQFEDSLDAIVERTWPGLDRARTPLAAYCYGADCIRSRNGCSWAARRGFTHLEWFRGGIAEWESANLPTIRESVADGVTP
ncbi:MAG: rhodanese-like domain-containing protein [bacterium]